MTDRDMRTALQQQPFRPFRVILSDGKNYDIKHPELVMVLKRVFLVGLMEGENDSSPDTYDTVSFLHVVRLEPLPASQAS